MSAFYNENDPFMAGWLRELMKEGCITEGAVDERSIEDIAPEVVLGGHRRCHWFAGIGTWDAALTLAGFPADREVWTASCPCQPFSSAGKRAGFADERHLWGSFFHQLSVCRPQLCFGEQVASDDGFTWLDLVHDDLESVGYEVGAVVTPAAGYGSPQGRHRIYWCARDRAHAHRDERAQQSVELHGSGGTLQSGGDGALPDPANADGRSGEYGAEEAVGSNRKRRGRPRKRRSDGAVPDPSNGGLAPGLDRGEDGAERAHAGGGEQSGLRIADAPDGGGSDTGGLEHTEGVGRCEGRSEHDGRGAAGGRGASVLVNAIGGGVRGRGRGTLADPAGGGGGEEREQRVRSDLEPAGGAVDATACGTGELADPDGGIGWDRGVQPSGQHRLLAAGSRPRLELGDPAGERPLGAGGDLQRCQLGTSGATGGFWGNAIWLPCTDGKLRAVEPVPVEMADGLASDLGLVRLASGQEIFFPTVGKTRHRADRIRGYGNAIVLWQAVAFIQAVLEDEKEGG